MAETDRVRINNLPQQFMPHNHAPTFYSSSAAKPKQTSAVSWPSVTAATSVRRLRISGPRFHVGGNDAADRLGPSGDFAVFTGMLAALAAALAAFALVSVALVVTGVVKSAFLVPARALIVQGIVEIVELGVVDRTRVP
jgi:hypothetical protein